ncbi:MAG: MBL fold metallo-hydrolase [Sandaracinaceae bacterium]|nr:MBL fold metallo-hydrolase [Sandaracinaceae bacterium]
MRPSWIGALLLAASCGGDGDGRGDAGRDAGGADAGADAGPDAGGADAGSDASASDGGIDGGPDGDADAGAPDAGAEPTEALRPVPGEVTILLLRLPGLVRLGEAAILVGPDGTLVLMDVGNSSHADVVRDMVRALNTSWITPARGFPRARRPLEVDWIVVSHFHSDHVGGFEDLVSGAGAVEVTRGIVHRGATDVGASLNEGHFETFCGLLSGPLAARAFPLCTAAPPAPCRRADWSGAHPATECAGLFLGALDDALDDALGAPSYVSLGGGARMAFVAASGFVSDGARAHPMPAFGHSDSNEENARSVVTLIEHGAFRYHWGGDLTGSGDPGEPDVESHLVAFAGPRFYEALGSDVVQAHHHVRRTSSNATFVGALVPLDGRSRNVVGGINGGHAGSPHREVLARFGDDGRLGDGRIWITMSAVGGGSHPTLVNADADVIVQTLGGGAGYRVQAARATPESRAYRSVR